MPGPALFARPKPPAKPAPEIPEFKTLDVSETKISEAVRALLSYVKKTSSSRQESLLDAPDNDKLLLSITLNTPSPREYHNPIRIPLVHPIFKPPRAHSVCLFVKDPKSEVKDRLEAANVHFINKVIGLDKLQKKYKSFEAKRELLRSYDLFLVDDRVVPEVGRFLGKVWRKAKKNPYAVSLTKKHIKSELEKAIASTYLVVNMGTNLTLRVGTLEIHSEQDLVDNVKAAISQMAARAPQGGWSNIQNLYLKTNSSVALLIFQKNLDVNDRFAKKRPGAQQATEDENIDTDSSDDEAKVEVAPKSKSQKSSHGVKMKSKKVSDSSSSKPEKSSKKKKTNH